MVDVLKELRRERQIMAKEVVEVVRQRYPKFDKVLQSKIENPEYGITLCPEAMNAVYAAFAPERQSPPEAARARKKDGHRLTCRITARLGDEEYARLQQRFRADGYATAQAWITEMVRRYLGEEEKTDDSE